jgi:hypothetical protein
MKGKPGVCLINVRQDLKGVNWRCPAVMGHSVVVLPLLTHKASVKIMQNKKKNKKSIVHPHHEGKAENNRAKEKRKWISRTCGDEVWYDILKGGIVKKPIVTT